MTQAESQVSFRESLKRIFKHLKFKERKPWIEKLKEEQTTHPLQYPANGMRGQHVIDRICAMSKGKALVTTDVGVTFGFVLGVGSFYFYLKKPSALRLAGVGLAAGLCLGAKLTGILQY